MSVGTAPAGGPRVPGEGVPWEGLPVCVAGVGVSGRAAARVLAGLGAAVTAVDVRDDDATRAEAARLEGDRVTVQLGAGAAGSPPAGTELVVTSPGWRPTSPLLLEAERLGVPVWGEVELAWRLRPGGPDAAPWLAVTGTNGKTTTVGMLAAILRAAGLRASEAGNIGTPLVEVVRADPAPDVLAVELSSFQLHWSSSLRALAAVCLNVAPDHLDWHGGLDAYAADKAKVYAGVVRACVYPVDQARCEAMVREADVAEGAVAVGVTLGAPAAGQLGVVEGLLLDRAFGEDRHRSAVELAGVEDVRPAGTHNVGNALAAAALARAAGVPAEAVSAGLRAYVPGGHRISQVAVVRGVAYVDDSKATNGHAAAASLTAYPSVVWVAGGLAKGATFDDVVRQAAPRLRAAVLLGSDRALLAEALARHAPDVPVVEVAVTDTGAMDEVVHRAAALARPGDTVLLAPACASMDMFADYAARGEAFAAAVRRLDAAGTA